MIRYLAEPVRRDLARKMAFVAGPRQVGKTTLARQLLPDPAGYLNWDIAEDRERLLRRQLPDAPLLVLDEIHKYRSWRDYLKGLYDAGRRSILVTGSARLDFYRFGGDSLQGRYHLFRMHPLSVAELGGEAQGVLAELLTLGGFPEPFFGKSAVDAKRWSREYRTRLVREDLVSLERVQDLGNIELLMLRLPELVASPLSINGLREDLRISHKSVANWIDILERLYAVYRLAPFGAPKLRAVKKERKHYHMDWTVVPGEAARFENLVASHLLKWCHFQEDVRGRGLELRYFRDVDGREVDFVVVEDGRPILFIEAKWSDDALNPALRYLKERFPAVDAWQVCAAGRKDFVTPEGIRVCPAARFLGTLV
jgi:predicted AAA+ superfamily ATPase